MGRAHFDVAPQTVIRMLSSDCWFRIVKDRLPTNAKLIKMETVKPFGGGKLVRVTISHPSLEDDEHLAPIIYESAIMPEGERDDET